MATAIGRLTPLLSDAARSTSQVFSKIAYMIHGPASSFPAKSKQLWINRDNSFNPEKHLAFIPPSKIYSMSDIQLKDSPLSFVAVSEPFRLFSTKAVELMRDEIFQPQVLEKYKYCSNLAPAQ